MAILVTVAQYRDARAASTPFPTGEDVILTDTGDNISNSVSGLTPAEIADLRNFNVDSIDATDDALVLSIQQFLSLGPVTLTSADVVTFQGSQADLEAGDAGDAATLAPANIDFIDATDDALTFTFEEYSALGSVSFTAADTVTITATAAQVQGLSPADIAAMSAKNVDILDPDGAVTLTAAQAAAFAASGISFPAADDVSVLDTGANIALLSPAEIAALGSHSIDALNASDDALTLTFDQYNSLGTVTLTASDTVSISATASTLLALDGAQLGALQSAGIDLLDASDNIVTLTAAQLAVLASTNLAFAANDTVTLSETGANIAGLDSTGIATLVAKGVDVLDASDDVVNLTAAQAQLLTGAGLSFAAADTVTVSDTGAVLAQLSAADIAALTAKGVDVIDATDNALTLTAAQAAALAGGGTSAASGDTVTVADTGAALGALTPAQLASLNGKGVDAINATDNVLALSVAQLKALGSVGLAVDDAVRLTDAGSILASLSADEISGLAARGVDTLDATDNAVTLSLSQYQSLGALQIAAEDRVTINGTSASERIDGRANNEYIKGFGGNDRLNGGDGNDWLSGGTGKDVLTGGRGADGFVFDTKPNKKTNYDTVKDFNVRDDSFYLDNAIFKKLGNGSEASPGKLKKTYFEVGTKADDRNDYLIYNKKTGVLYYDADGSGSAKQVEIAKLSKNLKMTEKDFFII